MIKWEGTYDYLVVPLEKWQIEIKRCVLSFLGKIKKQEEERVLKEKYIRNQLLRGRNGVVVAELDPSLR
jgi:hypothetical protein